jgi:hypothetical protein
MAHPAIDPTNLIRVIPAKGTGSSVLFSVRDGIFPKATRREYEEI